METNRMRVVTWNMGLAMATRNDMAAHDQAWHFLLGLRPDVALVQEALPPPWVRSEGTLIQGPFREWGSAIFCPRYPLEPHRPAAPSNLAAFGGYLAFARVFLPNGSEALVTSVHAPYRDAAAPHLEGLDPQGIKRPGLGKPRVNDAVF